MEEEYSRRLAGITKKAFGLKETDQMREALDVLRLETHQISSSHGNQASRFREEIYLPLESFISDMKARRKTVETNLEKLRKYRVSLQLKVAHSKEKYETECQKLKHYYAQSQLLAGKEAERLNQKIHRLETVISVHRDDYLDLTKEFHTVHDIWIKEWQVGCLKLQELEEERLGFLKTNAWDFVNVISTSCLADDTSCENVRLSLEKCDPKKELCQFVYENRTGNEIHLPNKFIDFFNGEQDQPEEVIKSKFDNKSIAVDVSFHSPSRVPPPILNAKEEAQYTFEKLHQKSMRQQQAESRDEPPRSPTLVSLGTNSTAMFQRSNTSNSSNPTTVSLDDKPRNWNSPNRRRSRNSNVDMKSSSVYSSSFNFMPQEKMEQEEPLGGDPLKTYLEDLSLGGNGDMNTLRSSMRGLNQVGKSEPTTPVNEKRVKKQVNVSKARPTSMYDNLEQYQADRFGNMSKGKADQAHHVMTSAGPLPSRSRGGYPVIKYSRAAHSYRAQPDEGEVSFSKNDILMVLYMREDAWWTVELLKSGEMGLAPSNYLVDLN